MKKKIPYKRVLLKLSGEILMGNESFGIDHIACKNIAKSLKNMQNLGIEVGIVIGGGNIFRGIHHEKMGLQRTPADHMGMLATMINGIALHDALTGLKSKSMVMSAIDCPKLLPSYSWQKANDAIKHGNIVIFVGGTSNPYFTTDTAAALRACEMEAGILLKATKVDGVYNRDPLKYSDAKKYNSLSYARALAEDLKVMDATSLALCRSNNIPIHVFNMKLLKENRIIDLFSKKNIGTIVKEH